MSTVIRAGAPPEKIVKRLEAVDLSDHVASARAFAQQARHEAQTAMDFAKLEASRLIAASHHRGYDEGFSKGERAGYEEGFKKGSAEGFETARAEAVNLFATKNASLLQSLATMLVEFERMKESTRLAASREVLEFAVDLATRITFKIGELERESAAANLQRALDLVDRNTDVTVRVNPVDLEAMSDCARGICEKLQQSRTIAVQSDDAVGAGGCVVSTTNCEVDATLATQIEEITRVLLGEGGAGG